MRLELGPLMLAHIGDEIDDLVDLCLLSSQPRKQGWTIDVWELTDEASAALCDLYRRVIIPDLRKEVLMELQEKGVPLEELLFDEERASETVTRSDMSELAAAACLIREGLPKEGIHLPNVPKGRRTYSSRGIDAIAVEVDDHSEELFSYIKRLHVCSVKHTVKDPADMHSKLLNSLKKEELSSPYIASQLRVLHGRMLSAGSTLDDLFLILADFPHPDLVRLIGVGTADVSHKARLTELRSRLPPAGSDARHLREILVKDIALLHERVSVSG